MHRLLLPLGTAVFLAFGAFNTASAHAVVVRGHPYHHYRHGPRVVFVRPAPVYAYRHARFYGPRWRNNVVIVRGPRHHHPYYWR